MEKNKKNALNRLLVGFAALGTLITAAGCSSTVQVSDNFRMQDTSKTYINPGPLTVEVSTPVYYTRPVIYTAPVVYGHGCYRPYRRSKVHGSPFTVGSHNLRNTMVPNRPRLSNVR